MTINKKVTGTASTIPAGLAVGGLVSAAMTLIGAAIAAKLINSEILPWDQAGYAVMIILLLAAWLGAVVAAGRIRRRRVAVCAASGITYMLFLLCVTALFFGGTYSGVGETGLLIFCGSTVAIFTGQGNKAGKQRIKTGGRTVKLNKIR